MSYSNRLLDSSGKKSVLVPLANGFEEIEAVTIVDILRRAGVSVTTSGLEKRNVKGSHGIPILADSVLTEEINKEWDMIVLPGGVPGAPNLAENKALLDLLKKASESEKYTAAVCAAPYALDQAGILEGKRVTIHPAWANKIVDGNYQGTRIMVDGKVITGQACGSAMEFAFQLVEILLGQKKVREVNQDVLAQI